MQRIRLWQGPDHLLYVAASPFGERYKRFYFADIRGFTLYRTSKWIWMIIVWALLAALCFWPVMAIDEPGGRIFFAIVGGCFLIVLAFHLIFGPTCSVTVHTAVQTERLPSLGRLRTARRVLARVRPLIEAAQPPPSPAFADS